MIRCTPWKHFFSVGSPQKSEKLVAGRNFLRPKGSEPVANWHRSRMYLFVKACRETETEGFLENGLFLEHQKSDMSYQVIQKLLIYQTLGIKGLIQVIYLYPPKKLERDHFNLGIYIFQPSIFRGFLSVFRGDIFWSRGRGPRRKHIPKLLAAPKALDVQFLWVTLVVDKKADPF